MKKLLISVIIFSSLFVGTANATTSSVKDEILSLSPKITAEELNKNIKKAASDLGKSEEEISNQILSELKVQENLDKKEESSLKHEQPISNIRNANPFNPGEGIYTLIKPQHNGDIFYEPSSTLYVNHGHVGIYWSDDTIVESLYGSGVVSKSIYDKKVETGTKVFTLSGVNDSTKTAASNWAYDRIGDPYSINFATNRETSYYGAKNCSKLVWSAYMATDNLDIDSNGGLGIYPKDILNYSKSSIYKSY